MAGFGKVIKASECNELPGKVAPTPEQREDCIRQDLLKRLKTVCEDLPEKEFRELVEAMTREQLRSERLH